VPSDPPAHSSARLAWSVAAVAVVALLGLILWHPRPAPAPPAPSTAQSYLPTFTIPVGKVRPPLPYRIVSFHRGRADKSLIKLASQLGFNGVQFQIEGSNEGGIADFADRDAKEHLIDYCHSLGMKVTVWVHELADLPGPWMPEYLGDVSVDNARMWATLDMRYEWILSKAIPNVDGLVLTVVETQVRATSTPMMLRLVDLVNRKCQEHNKSLIVRTFVWHPDELEGVMGAVRQLPKDMVIMSKVVPQDWQMRGTNAAEIGAVGGRPQIEEYDVAGEYFLRNNVANCFPDLLKKQFDYALSKNIQGICVRVDREDDTVLFQPQEVNLWALGMFAAGATDSVDEVWAKWAAARFGEKAAPAVTRALKPTGEVVAELLSIGPFTHGDTRAFPPMPDDYVFDKNWQNWRWDKSYVPTYDKAEAGDAQFVADVAKQKDAAAKLAEQCLADLEAAKPDLAEADYAILRTKLLTNKVQLQMRTPMVMAALHFRQIMNAKTVPQANAALGLYRKNLAAVHDLADQLTATYWRLPYGGAAEVTHLGRKWRVGAPLGIYRDQLYKWPYDAERILNYYW
jgi:hypothetical protein